MTSLPDAFLSNEDLDLAHLSAAELDAYVALWLSQAQATNDLDANDYNHGVFIGWQEPGCLTPVPLQANEEGESNNRTNPVAS